MIINRTPPRYPRRGPSCLLVLFVAFGVAVSMYVITNADEVRQTIIPTPSPEPTRSATEYALLADLSERDGGFAEAIEHFEAAIRLDGTKPEFFIRLINLLVRTGNPERALIAAEQVTVLAPDSDQVWTAVAAAYLANGERLSLLGDFNGAKLQYAQAVQSANKAIELNPQNATAYALAAAGLVLPQEPEKYALATERAEMAITLEPDNAVARLHMATVLSLQGYRSAAIEQLLLGIQADPRFSDLYINMAWNYFGNGSIPEAILSFQQALDVDPNNAVAYDGIAYMYLQLGEDATAEQNARRAVELNPSMARAHGRLGEAYFRQNNYPRAIETLKVAVELYGEPTTLNARFFNMLATAYYRTDMELCSEAVPILQQVLTVAVPQSPVEVSARDGLDECRRAILGTAP